MLKTVKLRQAAVCDIFFVQFVTMDNSFDIIYSHLMHCYYKIFISVALL